MKLGRDKFKSQSSPAKSTSSEKSFADGSPLTRGSTLSTSTSSSSIGGTSSILSRPLASRSLEEEEADDDEEIRDSLKIEISSARSRLSKTLSEILDDKDALGYFMQFMESRGKLPLIKFWMEVEFVRETADENIIVNNINSNDNLTADDNDNCLKAGCNGDNDNNEDSKDKDNNERPKTRLLLDNSMNCKSHDGDSEGMSSVFQDALKIYNRYIVKDNLRLGELTVEFKAQIEAAASNLNAVMLINGLLLAQKIVYKVLEDE